MWVQTEECQTLDQTGCERRPKKNEERQTNTLSSKMAVHKQGTSGRKCPSTPSNAAHVGKQVHANKQARRSGMEWAFFTPMGVDQRCPSALQTVRKGPKSYSGWEGKPKAVESVPEGSKRKADQSREVLWVHQIDWRTSRLRSRLKGQRKEPC